MRVRTKNNKMYRNVKMVEFRPNELAEITIKDENGSYLTIEVKTEELAAIIEE